MKHRAFPYIAISNWWALRKKFKERLPRQLTVDYLSTHLNMEPETARNLFPHLRRVGLIDAEHKPTELAERWCKDNQYAGVCAEIREAIYPPELLDTFPNPDTSSSPVVAWFKKETGLRSNVSGSMTAFYALLCRADPSEQDSGAPLKLRYSPRTSMTSLPGRAKESMSQEKPEQREAANGNVAKQLTKSDLPMSTSKENSLRFEPTMHITIQIHIPSDASAELIDNLFASMAKHLSFERQNR